ncbi:MAG: DNA polymerase IV [Parcubacteria group bacterium]
MPAQQHSWPRAYMHIDCDAFFASCEQAIHPEYRGKPVITGKERGIVAAASYEAKARGVSRGVPLWEVKKLIPEAIIVPSDYESYSLFSKRMFAIIRRFTPLVEEYSIDEAFAEITGLRRLYHSTYPDIARRIKTTIEAELGITVSVGLSLSKVLAKVGSKYQKPAGFTPIPGRKIQTYLAHTPLEKVWGIGPATSAYCRTLRLKTALDFARQPLDLVNRRFTKPHKEMWYELNGQAVYQINTTPKTEYATIGKTKTFTPASTSKPLVYAQLFKNLENACIKARRHQLAAGGLVLYLRGQDFSGRGVEARFSRPSAYPSDMTTLLRHLFDQVFEPGRPYRATGVILTNLSAPRSIQQSLFEVPLHLEKLERVYHAIDQLAAKWGKHCVHLVGSSLAHHAPQHVLERGDVPLRKQNRLRGESARKHLAIPMLLHTLH